MPSADATDRFYLECRSNGHQKFYDIWIEKIEDAWVIYAQYGKIGSEGRVIRKGSSSMSSRAVNKCRTLRNEKLAKGYVLADIPGSIGKKASLMKSKKTPKKVEQPTRKSIALERFAHILD